MSEIKIGIYDAKTHLTSLLSKVEKGEKVVITRHGKPVARLVSMKADVSRNEERSLALERLRIAHAGNKLDGFTIRDMINEGRR